MFISGDATTEIIAHFLGHFQIAVEDMRLRLSYEGIEARVASASENPELDQLSADFAQKFSLGNYSPVVGYTPPQWLISGEGALDQFSILPPVEFRFPTSAPAAVPTPALLRSSSNGFLSPQVGTEPGSLIAIIAQTITLSDNDVIVLGDYDGPLVFHSGADKGIVSMHEAGAQVTEFIPDLAAPNSVGDVPLFVENMARGIGGVAAGPTDAHTSLNFTEDLGGVYVDGEIVAAAPKLGDALPAPARASALGGQDGQVDDDARLSDHVVQVGDEVADIVTLKAGGNLLVNEALLVNAALNGSVVAVAGEVHQLDAIIQINAYLDIDTIAEDFPGSQNNPIGTTIAHNVATIAQDIFHSAGDVAAANPGVMPTNWEVSMVTGNLVFIQWLSQYAFGSDQDLAVLSSTGTSTLLTSGENIGLNSVSFADLGQFFDLILIGGNLYDANIIVQTNVLYDNDTIEMLSPETGAAGTLNTSGNMLWNQAAIHNVGPGQYRDDMPEHFSKAMDDLEDGKLDMPSGFGTDGQFEGIGMLKVLYIEGDVYDLRYVEQTNVLGDADFVATQQASLLASHPHTEWDISTGSNALVNIASITDYDGLSNTAYVGGAVYSDAILIQADILAADADDPSGDALVTEVVAFLDIDLEVDSGMPDTGFDMPSADGTPADIMQSVLS